jgi:hypothetical protein
MNITRTHRICCAAVLSGSLWLASAARSRANLDYTVTLNTASLIGNVNGPFSLDVVLGSGSQFPDSDNTVTLSSFTFTGGMAGAVTYSDGGETGSMSSTVTLTNSAEDNELAQAFSGTVTKIQFHVDETSNTNNPFPDQFDVAILDSSLNNIPTTDPSGGNTLVLSNINTAQTVASVQTYSSTATGEAPGVTASVPEPGSAGSLLLGLAGLGLCARWKATRRSVRA